MCICGELRLLVTQDIEVRKVLVEAPPLQVLTLKIALRRSHRLSFHRNLLRTTAFGRQLRPICTVRPVFSNLYYFRVAVSKSPSPPLSLARFYYSEWSLRSFLRKPMVRLIILRCVERRTSSCSLNTVHVTQPYNVTSSPSAFTLHLLAKSRILPHASLSAVIFRGLCRPCSPSSLPGRRRI